MDWENFLTEHVEHSADGKIWTITLLPDLKFSDGSPLTAQDVAFTYNQAAQGGGKIDMGNFSAARVLDDRRVEITLSAPQSTFVSVLGSLGIVPQHQYDAKTYVRISQSRTIRFGYAATGLNTMGTPKRGKPGYRFPHHTCRSKRC